MNKFAAAVRRSSCWRFCGCCLCLDWVSVHVLLVLFGFRTVDDEDWLIWVRSRVCCTDVSDDWLPLLNHALVSPFAVELLEEVGMRCLFHEFTFAAVSRAEGCFRHLLVDISCCVGDERINVLRCLVELGGNTRYGRGLCSKNRWMQYPCPGKLCCT